MSAYTKKIGDIGELTIMSKLIRYDNIIISRPMVEDSPYDLILDIDRVLYKVQIKTAEHTQQGEKIIFFFGLC